MNFRSLILASCLVAAGSLANADTKPVTAKEQAACKPDVRKFCAQIDTSKMDTQARDQAIGQCLNQNFAQLSLKCQTVFKAHNNM
jgi:hypothetical protein